MSEDMKSLKKGDTVFIDGQPHTLTWSSEEMTDQERREAHLRTADLMERYGLSGAFQRHLAEQYRSRSQDHQQ